MCKGNFSKGRSWEDFARPQRKAFTWEEPRPASRFSAATAMRQSNPAGEQPVLPAGGGKRRARWRSSLRGSGPTVPQGQLQAAANGFHWALHCSFRGGAARKGGKAPYLSARAVLGTTERWWRERGARVSSRRRQRQLLSRVVF